MSIPAYGIHPENTDNFSMNEICGKAKRSRDSYFHIGGDECETARSGNANKKIQGSKIAQSDEQRKDLPPTSAQRDRSSSQKRQERRRGGMSSLTRA